MVRKSKAQSTLEYVIVLTAIIGVIILWAANLAKDTDSGLGKSFNTAATKIRQSSNEIGKIAK